MGAGLTALLLICALPLVVTALSYAWQRHLLFPAPKRNAVMHAPNHTITTFTLAANGKRLHAVCAMPLGPTAALRSENTSEAAALSSPNAASASIVFFNGRREHPTSLFRALADLPHQSVLCFFYDGLGWSWRKPSERELVADGLAVLDAWAQHIGVPVERIGIVGRSLGSGLAVQVAAARPVQRLALISPYDRLASAVHARLPWLPRIWLELWLRDAFDARRHIDSVRCPCMLVVGEQDRTAPAAASRALFDGWPGTLTELALPDSGHRGILKRADVHRALGRFFAHATPASSSP